MKYEDRIKLIFGIIYLTHIALWNVSIEGFVFKVSKLKNILIGQKIKYI